MVTASNFHKIITGTGKLSKQSDDYIYELLASCIRPDEVTFEGNFHTDRGEALEPEARGLFAEKMNLEVRTAGFVKMDDTPVGCSPDGLIYRGQKLVSGLEIKCPIGRNHVKYLVEGVLPDQYRAQVHGSMYVTGLDSWYFMSYCQGFRPFIFKVERDDYTRQLGESIDLFIDKYQELYFEHIDMLAGKEAA